MVIPAEEKLMKLYYMKGACSLASYISLNEAGVKFEAVEVAHDSHKTSKGQPLDSINSKGYVPVLQLDDGQVLTENVAVLQYIADLNPSAALAPLAGTLERYRLVEFLAYINSELHKNFGPLFSSSVDAKVKDLPLAICVSESAGLIKPWGPGPMYWEINLQ
jgi:glutathione S-transferase